MKYNFCPFDLRDSPSQECPFNGRHHNQGAPARDGFPGRDVFLTPHSGLIQLPKSRPLIQLDTEEKNDV